MLQAAHTDAPLVQADALRLPLAGATADGATCCFALRNFVELPGFFAELARVVRPGGRIALLEVAEPPNRVVRAGHRVYFERVVPRIGALLSARGGAYEYLPASVIEFPQRDGFTGRIAAAGFGEARWSQLTGGVVCLYQGSKP